MKICLYPYNEGAGTSTYILELSHALCKLNHDVVVIGTAEEQARKHKLTFVRTPKEIKSQYNVVAQLPPFSYLDFFTTPKYLKPIIERHKPDIFHMSTHLYPKQLPVKTVVTAWDYIKSPSECAKTALQYSKTILTPYRIVRELEMSAKDRLMYKHVNLVIGINQYITEKLNQAGLHAAYVPPGMTIPKDPPLKNTQLTLCFIARNHLWVKRKGLHLLLNALKLLNNKHLHIDYKLYLIGKIPWLNKYYFSSYSMLQKHITVEGLLPREKVMDIIGSSHILVVPSLYEEFGYVAIEALAKGTAIVVSRDNHSFTEMVKDESGITTDIYDASQFAKDLELLMTNQKYLQAYMQKALQRAKEKYDVFIIAKKMTELYEMILS